jgi:carbon monoxide dehydrogenase subunit G
VRLENSFVVPTPPDQAWALLMDVPRIIPCVPGAKLDETVDDSNWKATVAVKLGPVSLSFKADVKREEADEAARRATLSARAREARGRGNASATIESSLTPEDGGTRVDIVTELQLAGTVAQYGGRLVQDVASQLVTQFAGGIETQLAETHEPEPPSAEAEPEPQPLDGLQLGLGAARRSVGRPLRRYVVTAAVVCLAAGLVVLAYTAAKPRRHVG